ncbi:hypothetical protein FOZ62_016474, partial [Perkinsus olseni]
SPRVEVVAAVVSASLEDILSQSDTAQLVQSDSSFRAMIRFPNGFATSKQMELLAIPELTGDSDAPLFIWNVARVEKVKGGWNFHITFTAFGQKAGKDFKFT